MSSEPILVAERLTKIYQVYKKPEDRLKQLFSLGMGHHYFEYAALRDVSFELRRGESVGIVGRNGAGKSTLLQLICGTTRPTSGRVWSEAKIAALLELGAGFNPEFTGRENVYLAGSILGLSTKQIESRFDKIATFAGIGDFIEQAVKLYSSGMYARLAFAVAAHVDASILIVDEILSVGDAAFTQKCMRFIHEFKKEGTLLFVSHDTSAITSLCDRALWIDRGEMRSIGPAREIVHQYIASLYGQEDSSGEFSIGGERKRQLREGRSVVDGRAATLRESRYRNDIEIFDFDPDSPWFGNRGASIVDVKLLDANERAVAGLGGGEEVVLEVHAEAHGGLDRPIIGFYVKNPLGQNLFGDNTFLTYFNVPMPVVAGQRLTARFHFQMPFLPSGDYAVNVAIANGTQTAHVQHHWVDDALFFRVEASHVAKGLIGIPMLDITMEASAPNAEAAA